MFSTLLVVGLLLFGDEDACGGPILVLVSEESVQASTELFV